MYVFQWNLHWDSALNAMMPALWSAAPQAHIRARPAWDITRGDSSVKILLVDNGIGLGEDGNILHRDFDTAFVRKGQNYLFPGTDSLPQDGTGNFRHGTRSAGIISATTDNHYDIAGIAPRCILYASKILDPASTSVAYANACSLDVDIVVANQQTPVEPEYLSMYEPYIRGLDSCGKLVIAARGNDTSAAMPGIFAEWDSELGSSGGFDNVVCVGGLGYNARNTEPYHNDSSFITVCAPGPSGVYPGVQTLAAKHATGFTPYNNTSCATPHVAGVAALIMSHYDGITPSEVRTILEASADKIWDDPDILDTLDSHDRNFHGAAWHTDYGYGRVNAFRALNGWYGTLASCDTTWSTSTLYGEDNRVYIADLTIDSSCTLTVEAGIQVRAITTDVVDGTEVGDANSYPCELTVKGRLIVNGTPEHPVLLSSTQDSSLPAWSGIHVKAGGFLSLKYTQIENANIAITLDPGATIDTLVGVNFVNCVTALNVSGQTVVLADVSMAGVSQYGFIGDTASGLAVTGAFEVVGSAGDETLFSPKNGSAVPGWTGIVLHDGSSIDLNWVRLTNPDVAIEIDSGASVSSFDLRNVSIVTPVDYGIYSEFGTAVVRLDSNVTIVGRPATTICVLVANDTRLVAKHSTFSDGQSGIRANANGVDSIINCRILDQSTYGAYFWSGDAADYTMGNVFENEDSSSTVYGLLVELQSINSVSDNILGGFNWGFYTARPTRANVTDLVMEAKEGDNWGLYMYGPEHAGDSAYIDHAVITGNYGQAHCYMSRMLCVVENSDFISSGDGSATPYGIMDKGGPIVYGNFEPTTGRVACCVIKDQKTESIGAWAGSYITYGDAISPDYGWNNIYVVNTAGLSTEYFYNHGNFSKKAEQNWWGSDPPDTARFTGSVDRTPHEPDSTECGGEGTGGDNKVAAAALVPAQFELEQNVPNPFNPSTLIRFALPRDQHVRMEIVNVLGQIVRTYDLGMVPAGRRAITWSGRDDSGDPVGSGVYLYRIITPEFTLTKRMLLIK